MEWREITCGRVDEQHNRRREPIATTIRRGANGVDSFVSRSMSLSVVVKWGRRGVVAS